MMLNDEEGLQFLDHFFMTQNFLLIFPLKRPARFFLWMYTIFFGIYVKLTTTNLIEVGLNFTLLSGYMSALKWILSFICFIVLLLSLYDHRALRGAFISIYVFQLLCIFQVSQPILITQEKSVFELHHVYLTTMFDLFENVEYYPIKYFCYTMFTLTTSLGWHISRVIYSYHREIWIPIDSALEGDVADLHIESISPRVASTSDQKKKKASRKRGKRR